jgi:hypothetical protein
MLAMFLYGLGILLDQLIYWELILVFRIELDSHLAFLVELLFLYSCILLCLVLQGKE